MTKRSNIGTKRAKSINGYPRPSQRQPPPIVRNRFSRDSKPDRGSDSFSKAPMSVPEGHYAGCKFTAPPSCSTLPLPPMQWLQTNQSVIQLPNIYQQINIVQHLKILLKINKS
ncbi:hypothetical protein GWI33_013376 [Rhynchophorus ferrugineus]|uniref:Uncharacterized protein n=1 Tax=Rhynchophorus ferrugineus TaxID=354439 RepID=A0A834IH55_RHYFE|nr:hypothetical protein GWI33_013376 [Rhynchophorus ferrugineus]